ncbi:MAG: hypothetical protein OES79_03350 [Planctomycetota bacterium]|nr:hypothetical protein [Planctomycetota bacterium]
MAAKKSSARIGHNGSNADIDAKIRDASGAGSITKINLAASAR